MSGFSSPGGSKFVLKKECNHVWDWTSTFVQSKDALAQDRKCIRCKITERVGVCRDRIVCEECSDTECQCSCHKKS